MITRLITLVSIVSLLIFATWSFWRPLSATATTFRLPGTVEIHELRLGSKVEGRVKTVLVEEGDTVKVGQTLVELDIPELRARRTQLESQICAAEAQLRKWKAGARIEEKQAAHADVQAATARRRLLMEGPRYEEIEEARGEVNAIAAELEQAALNLKRELGLRARDVSTAEATEEATAIHGRLVGRMHTAKAHLQLLEAGTRPAELQEAQAKLERAIADAALLDAGSRPEDVEEADARVAELKAKLDELDSQIAESTIKSPATAVIEVISIRPGEIIAASQPVIRALEPEELWVKAYVSEVDLGKIRLNQTAAVTIDAYPTRRFPGTITFIANTSEFTPRNVQTINERRHQVFAIKVRVQDTEKIFKSGMAADVWVESK